jgi:2-keto-4-pentenoate hydratase/2-oxohepta-3-ene-1,7-dioic acid hydratase in catechol pathway
MKLATLKNGTGVVVIDDHLVALDGVPHDVTAVLAAGPQVASDVSLKAADAALRTPLVEADLGAPIPRPSKYLAIGFNYKSHLAEIQEAATQPQLSGWAAIEDRSARPVVEGELRGGVTGRWRCAG